MTVKFKVNEEGQIVVGENGKPIIVLANGSEQEFDLEHTLGTITRLNGEAKTHREAKEDLDKRLKLYEGIDDPEAARKALQTMQNLNDKQLVDAGEVEKVKQQVSEGYVKQLQQKDEALQKLQSEFNNEIVGGKFSGSKYIAENLSVPYEMARAYFGNNFEYRDGRLIGKLNGNEIYSRANPAEFADFDEALDIMVSTSPFKDSILKGNGSSGGGFNGNNPGGNGGTSKMPASLADCKTQEEKVAYLKHKTNQA